ncbi:MAG: GNAT family N-acetyltransferase [Gemmatimonadaceae bacterium]
MSMEIRYEHRPSLERYAMISIAYDVGAVLDVEAARAGGVPLPRDRVTMPYRKDYDAVPGNHPREWPARFDVDRAEFLAAWSDDRRIGGAVVIVEATDIVRLGGQAGDALLWDLRVAPAERRRGVGRALLAGAEAIARAAGMRGLTVETQDVNFPACQLYSAAGYVITSITPGAYPDLPEETRVVWTKTVGLRNAADKCCS